jgi:hypothetical protein
MVATAGKLGYGEYRAHLSFMDLAADQFGFNHHAQRRFNETIKDALDPNGIIAPGKWASGARVSARRDSPSSNSDRVETLIALILSVVPAP